MWGEHPVTHEKQVRLDETDTLRPGITGRASGWATGGAGVNSYFRKDRSRGRGASGDA